MRRANDPQRREKIMHAGGKSLRNTCCYAPQNCYLPGYRWDVDDLLFFEIDELLLEARSAVLLRPCPGNIRHF